MRRRAAARLARARRRALQQEWIWRARPSTSALFARPRPPGARREHAVLPVEPRRPPPDRRGRCPTSRLVAVVRDPVDRAYSNWMHLWSDGLEPVADFVSAFAREDERVAAGWAPFWRYRGLGLLRRAAGPPATARRPRARAGDPLPRARRRRPARRSTGSCRFLGIRRGPGRRDPPRTTHRAFVAPGAGAAAARAGRAHRRAARRSSRRPQVWRRASRPLIRACSATAGRAPAPARRRAAARLVAELRRRHRRCWRRSPGEDFGDWRSTREPRLVRQRARAVTR